MEGNLVESLKEVLSKDDRLISHEGDLLKNKVVELGWKLDEKLIETLHKNKELKQHFFKQIDGALIFDQNKFMKFVDNKEFLPDSFTSFKNKIGLTQEDSFISKKGEVVLSWAYKDCILEGGMTKEDKEKRPEVFFNEILAPDQIDRLKDTKVLTNFKRYSKKGTSDIKDIKSTDNLIIKGNNLLALHTLKKKFVGRVKLIYIDPPYNTGSDSFNYNDSFNHSTWLTFMKNRLEVAKELLSNDGVIFVQVDYRELAYLKVLIDEIFYRDNFIGQINWQRVPEGRTLLGQGESDLKISTEYLLIYAKNKKPNILNNGVKKRLDCTEKIMQQYSYKLTLKSKPKEFKRIKDSNGNDVIFYKIKDFKIKPLTDKTIKSYSENYENMVQSVGIQEESTFQQKLISITKDIDGLCIIESSPTRGKRKGKVVKDYFIKSRKLLFVKDFSILENNRFYREGDINDFWTNTEIQVTDIANEGGVLLRRGKKPEKLIQRVIELATEKGDIVLDYHLGSGTTCAVAHKMGRQYIGVEQLDYEENGSVTRLKNVIEGDQSGISKDVRWKGGGEFVYCELMNWNQNFVDKIAKAKTSKELMKIWDEMKKKAFLSYRVKVSEFDSNKKEFGELGLENQKKFLIKTLDMNQLYVNLSEVEDKSYGVSKEDKELNKKFHGGL